MVEKEEKLSLEKFQDSIASIKNFSSNHKKATYIQHKDHSFLDKKCFLLVSRQNLSTKLWYHIFVSTSRQFMSYRKNMGLSMG